MSRRRPRPLAVIVLAAAVSTALLLAAWGLLCGAQTAWSWLEDRFAAQPEPAPTATGPAPVTLDTTGFDPAYLIDDAVFYDSATMSVQDVTDFIATVNDGCVPGTDGTVCLAQARFEVEAREPSLTCPGGLASAQDATAGEVIWAVSQACDLNPQALLVLIQKEQGLLTASGPTLTARDYEAAAGYACPDGAACDPAWAGFVNQVYGAASQFQRYRLQPGGFRVRAGVPVILGHSPDPACGGGEVTAANQATAGLYNYTPYLPNEAVTSGAGGDECSSFSAWAFYGYFRTFFGDPTPQRTSG